MNKFWTLERWIAILAFIYVLMLIAPLALAAPPYDVTVTFNAPSAGGPVGGYNFYIDDCAATGATAAAVGAVVSGQTFVGAITADGTYLMCVRTFANKPNPTFDVCEGDNAPDPLILICENPDPGQVATVAINDAPPLPGTIQNLGVQVTCVDSNCTVVVTVQ